MPNTRVPHEYADLLDVILAPLDDSARVYVRSPSPQLTHAVAIRHGNTTTDAHQGVAWLRELSPGLEFVDHLPHEVDHVVICEPTDASVIARILDGVPEQTPCDCVVGNPYSFNRVEDRSLTAQCSPVAAWRVLREAGYSVSIEGMHGLQSILQSVIGKAWQLSGRLDRRDVHTHRMRAAYREQWLPFALTSCLVHFSGVPE